MLQQILLITHFKGSKDAIFNLTPKHIQKKEKCSETPNGINVRLEYFFLQRRRVFQKGFSTEQC
jgi:hypothetical protein